MSSGASCGPSILAADALESNGLEVPRLSDRTIDELRSFLPHEAGVANPVDMIASAPPEHFRRTFTRGQLDTRPLVLYVSVTVFCLFMTVRSLESRRMR